MSALEHHRLRQIDSVLRRSVSVVKLEPVASVSPLKPAQIEVVKFLARWQLVSALDYMRAVVPTAFTGELMRFINQFA